MKWPWLARSAHEEVCARYEVIVGTLVDERDRLRSQNDELLDHVVRMDRVEHGRPEIAPTERKKPEPMPREVQDFIRGFGNETIRKEQEAQAYAAYKRLGSWNAVLNDLKRGVE